MVPDRRLRYDIVRDYLRRAAVAVTLAVPISMPMPTSVRMVVTPVLAVMTTGMVPHFFAVLVTRLLVGGDVCRQAECPGEQQGRG